MFQLLERDVIERAVLVCMGKSSSWKTYASKFGRIAAKLGHL